MKKRILSITLVAVLLLTIFNQSPYFKSTSVVQAETFRNGFSLTPDKEDATGISTDTTFAFKAETAVTLDEVIANLKMTPAVTFTVTQEGTTFKVTFSEALKMDSIYKFSYQSTDWAFQTTKSFDVLGSLPTNQSTNVPIDSGIELYFTHQGADVEKYFEISPAVTGKFESHDNVVVFVPKKLEEKTLYTVTLKKGLPLGNSTQTLTEDYVFTFETSATDSGTYVEPKGYFSFNNFINEFSTTESINIPMNFYMNQKQDSPVKTKIYAYDSIEKFADALKTYNSLPRWSYYTLTENEISTKGLSEVSSFEQVVQTGNANGQSLQVPGKLPAGYYVVSSQWEDVTFQTFIQVTDLSFYVMTTFTEDLVWINDLSTKQPVKDATVSIYGTQISGTTNESGVASIKVDPDKTEMSLFIMKAGSKSAVYIDYNNYVYASYNSFRYGYDNSANKYWRYLQTDRNLYQPTDTVEFWGFLQNRYASENIENVTVEIDNMGWYYFSFLPNNNNELPLLTKTFEVNNGFYEGKLDIPNLPEGGYQVKVKVGDQTISTSYITVQKYTKPDYKIEVTKDKNAIFLGETVNFSAKTSFYEGTPVANLDVNYNISGLEYINSQLKSSLKGLANVAYTPKEAAGYQGQMSVMFNAFASLPESGQVAGADQVTVYINDILADIQTTLKSGVGTIDVQVNKVDLTKINNPSTDPNVVNDAKGAPVQGQALSGNVYKKVWLEKEVGEYYDYINKVVRKQYEYYEEVTQIQNINLTTDAQGKAHATLNLPKLENGYYAVDFKIADTKERPMTFTNYFYESWESQDKIMGYPATYDWYRLVGDKDNYNIGETMKVQYSNNDTPINDGSFLFVKMQNGILDTKVQSSGLYNAKFEAKDVPNVEIQGIWFNGKTYVAANTFSPRINLESKRIYFTIKKDQESYSPGGTAKISVAATYLDPATNKMVPLKNVLLNLSIVDEALLSLSDQYIDTLESVYEWVSSGLLTAYGSHNNTMNNSFIPMNYGGAMGGKLEMATTTETTAAQAPMADGAMNVSVTDAKGADTASVYVRTEFKDTAFFKVVALDDQGLGTIEFKLPDNVTTWRMTFAGISSLLEAGNQQDSLVVTQPFIINTNLNTTYLVGDQPYVGITAYGTDLKENEKITYEIADAKTGFKATATGIAYERVNVPLWKLTEGSYELTIKAVSETGLKDGIQEKIQVVKTYLQKDVADYYNLITGMSITSTDFGMTDITILDQGQAKYLAALYNLAYSGGKRIDQKVVATKAAWLLSEKFNKELFNSQSVTLSDYLQNDGGFALLPYAPSDLETTVKLLPLIKDEASLAAVKQYFYNELANPKSLNKDAALYGLAQLGEPVLLELQNREALNNLSFKDHIYQALTYAQLQDTFKAEEIYTTFIQPKVVTFQALARVKGLETEDKDLEASALLLLLSSKLGVTNDTFKTLNPLLFQYVSTSYSKEVLVSLELMTYILDQINQDSSQPVKVTYIYDGKTYNGQTVDGSPITFKVPSSKLSSLKFTSVEGTAGLVASYVKPEASLYTTDSDLSISRNYYNYSDNKAATTFKQSDVVKVVLNWSIDKKATDDYYTVTDYVPSGLVPIENPWELGLNGGEGYWYREMDGQKVTFFISKYNEANTPLYYYARVITPGTYQAEKPMIQGTTIKESMVVGESQIITIQP